jgi:hypothetical protein
MTIATTARAVIANAEKISVAYARILLAPPFELFLFSTIVYLPVVRGTGSQSKE